MTANIVLNAEHNGIEIYFDAKPARAVLDKIKDNGFRWYGKKKAWIAKNTAARLSVANAIAAECSEGSAVTVSAKPAAKAAQKNKYGVKIGDLFYTSWGYEQTNVNFFQVIAFRGASSVVVREVHPRMVEETGVSGMSNNRKYEVSGEILPPSSSSLFINDNENGDVRRMKESYYGNEPCFKVGKSGSYQDTARPYHGQAVYESWYY